MYLPLAEYCQYCDDFKLYHASRWNKFPPNNQSLMVVLWQKKIGDDLYEVRSAGGSRRLYKNNVCHSQFNSRNILTGSIWDLLLLPVCYQPEVALIRVLVLGVGGGAVIHQLHHLFQPTTVIGVDNDPLHLELGKRYFDLDLDGLKLVESDVVAWLNDCREINFDLIVEDVFVESERRPIRSVLADGNWLLSLLKKLSPRGILVMNFSSVEEFRDSVIYHDRTTHDWFSAIYQITSPTLDNVVIAMHKYPVIHAAIHRNIIKIPELKQGVLSRKLKYRMRRLR